MMTADGPPRPPAAVRSGRSIPRLERSLLEAVDAALDEADWRALDDLINILDALTLRTSRTRRPPMLH